MQCAFEQLPESECNGCFAAQNWAGLCEPVACVDSLNCNCHLPDSGIPGCSGTLMEYQGGSRQMNEAYTQQIPDKLYSIDAISCKDQSTAANGASQSANIGTHTFTISGNIEVAEHYEDAGQRQSQERERSNACYHREQRTELLDNIPANEGAPCVCA